MRAEHPQPLEGDAERVRELGGRAQAGRILLARIERALPHRHAQGTERDLQDVGDDQRLAALERALDRKSGSLLVERRVDGREENRTPAAAGVRRLLHGWGSPQGEHGYSGSGWSSH